MEATKRAKEQQERRERQHRIAKGLEVSDDEADDKRPAHMANAKEVEQKPVRVEDVKSDEEKEDEEHTWLRPDLGDGGVDEEDDDEHDERPTKKGKKEKSPRGVTTMRMVCRVSASTCHCARGSARRERRRSWRRKKRKRSLARHRRRGTGPGAASRPSEN